METCRGGQVFAPRPEQCSNFPDSGVRLRASAIEGIASPSFVRTVIGRSGRNRLSEIASLTWGQVIPRETGEVQLALIGKGDKERHVLIPANIAKGLLALRGDAPPSARVFPITERRINQLIKAAAKRAKVNPEASAHWFRHAHASHAIDNGAPITLVSQTLGHADLKTTSVYAHARPNESSSRYLQSRSDNSPKIRLSSFP